MMVDALMDTISIVPNLKSLPVSVDFLRKVLNCSITGWMGMELFKSLYHFILCIKVIPIYFIFCPMSYKTVHLMLLCKHCSSDVELRPGVWSV